MRELGITYSDTGEVARQTELIRKRAEGLARRIPDAAASLAQYVERQERECAMLETEVVGAVWLLRRA